MFDQIFGHFVVQSNWDMKLTITCTDHTLSSSPTLAIVTLLYCLYCPHLVDVKCSLLLALVTDKGEHLFRGVSDSQVTWCHASWGLCPFPPWGCLFFFADLYWFFSLHTNWRIGSLHQLVYRLKNQYKSAVIHVFSLSVMPSLVKYL